MAKIKIETATAKSLKGFRRGPDIILETRKFVEIATRCEE